MTETAHDGLIENLVLSSFIAFIAVFLGAASFFTESFTVSSEQRLVSSITGPILDSSDTRINDPAFSRIYSVKKGSSRFAVVISLPHASKSFRTLVLFKSDGSLAEARVLGGRSVPSWIHDIPLSESETYPQSVRDDLARYRVWSEAVRRASLAVVSFKEGAL